MSHISPPDDDSQFRDPTSPAEGQSAEPGQSAERGQSGEPSQWDQPSPVDHTAPIDTSQTQQVPPVPPTPPTPPQNPYAPSNPYASPNPYATQAPYANQPATYGPPSYQQAGAYRPSAPLTGGTITLLVLSGLTTLGCGFGIVALIFAIIAAAKKDDPAESAKFTRWGWIALVVGFVLTLLVVGVLIAVGLSMSSSSDVSGY
jgi:hypothetical protein